VIMIVMQIVFFYDSNYFHSNIQMNVDWITHAKAVKYYRLARFMANTFSKDESTKVAALFIAPLTHEILTLGYNGMPRGIDETRLERLERPLKYEYFEHAERNAIFNAARTGTSLKNSICIVTLFPCSDCARGIIQSGSKMVISLDPLKVNDEQTIERWKDKWSTSKTMLEEAGVVIYFLDKTDVLLSLGKDIELIQQVFDGLVE